MGLTRQAPRDVQARCILAGPEEERGSQVWNASATGEEQGIPGPRWAVDFIARMEFMEEDMQVRQWLLQGHAGYEHGWPVK